MTVPARVGLVGGGVIGAAWAARFALAGSTVMLADPAPGTPAIVDQVMARARAAWVDLELPIDDTGSCTVCSTIGDAVAGATHVQESVPERLDLKQAVLAEIEAHSDDDTVIASSTSGFRPSVLQEGLRCPERLVVGHPFNPVYLLPLVEVVGGAATADAAIDTAMATYRSLGMEPLHVRVEIDAFIADRLLEAVWREALWLVADGVATTEEIDRSITHGFGLRWAQMGLFETYRTAGGPGGFRHFLEQFGPALAWPWTKLMDTPAFTPELVDRIVEQSDAQSGHLEVQELERARDANLVAILQALEANRWGAGRTIAEHRQR